MIMMFSGSTIPSGWAICNGEGGTPNLVDKFILGGTLDSLGGRNSISLSGDKNNKVWTEITDSQTPSINLSISGHRLTVDEMPNHEHTEGLKLFWSDDIDSRYSNGLWQKERGLGTNLGSKATTEGVTLAARTSTAGWGKEHSHGGTAAQASHSHAVSVSAPYYVLVFIIKVDG
ncbi:hypothetical protein C1Y31_16245 [Pseudomonas sp. FW305-25]|nr:hypothetical protein C1Y31_16245 [Pseudomonas sp. FW305-25]PMY69286.1 hypothetical protein C1Y32_16985 [Pseudomonas sp. FW126-L8]PNA80126.1 hypothetical protein C1Y33_12555 [Pseudomonas sp. FW305-76]